MQKCNKLKEALFFCIIKGCYELAFSYCIYFFKELFMGNYVNRLASRFASNFVSKHPKPSDEKPETNKRQNTALLPKAVGDVFDELVRIKITPTEWGHARGAWIFDHSPDWLDNEEVPALGLYVSQTLLKKLDVGSDENNNNVVAKTLKDLNNLDMKCVKEKIN
jgi:hypothetical protein